MNFATIAQIALPLIAELAKIVADAIATAGTSQVEALARLQAALSVGAAQVQEALDALAQARAAADATIALSGPQT